VDILFAKMSTKKHLIF